MKEKAVLELKKCSEKIRKARNQTARAIKEEGIQNQESFERVLRAVHQMDSLLFSFPARFPTLFKILKTMTRKEGINR